MAKSHDIEWAVVKGVAGYGNLDQSSCEDDWMAFASALAASFVVEVLCDHVNQGKC